MMRGFRSDSGFRLGGICVLFLAFSLRVGLLGNHSMWFDEGLEFWVAKAPLGELLPTIRAGILDPPLYSVMLHYWMGLGTQEIMLRFLSIALSMLMVSSLMLAAKRWLGVFAGLSVGLIVTVSASQIYYAQEIGQYALMSLALVINLLALERALHTGMRRAWWIWAGAAILCVYSYYGAAISVAAVVFASALELIMRRQWRQLAQLAIASAGVVLICAPLALFFIPMQLPRGPGNGVIVARLSSFLNEVRGLIEASKHVIQFQVVGSGSPAFGREIPDWSIWLPIVVALVLAVSNASHWNSMDRRLVVWLISVWGFYALAGKLNVLPFGGFRHSLIIAPLLLLVIALGIKCARRVHWGLSSALLIWLITMSLSALPQAPGGESLVASYWRRNRLAGEPTYVYYGAVPTFSYYTGPKDIPVNVGQPGTLWYMACWAGYDSCPHHDGVFYGTWFRGQEPALQVSAMQQMLGDWPRRLWLIFSHTHKDEDRRILDQLQGLGYSIVGREGANGALAVILER